VSINSWPIVPVFVFRWNSNKTFVCVCLLKIFAPEFQDIIDHWFTFWLWKEALYTTPINSPFNYFRFRQLSFWDNKKGKLCWAVWCPEIVFKSCDQSTDIFYFSSVFRIKSELNRTSLNLNLTLALPSQKKLLNIKEIAQVIHHRVLKILDFEWKWLSFTIETQKEEFIFQTNFSPKKITIF